MVSTGRTATLAALVALSAMPACDPEDASCDVATDDLSALVTAIDSDGQVTISVDLRRHDTSPSGTPVELCAESDEALRINGESAEVERYEGVVRYVRSLAPAARYEVELERAGQRHVLAVNAPPAFEVDAPAPEAELSRAEALTLAWTPAAEGAEIDLKLERDDVLCLEGWEARVPDAGELTLPPDTLRLTEADAGPDCSASFVFTRQAEGSYPAALHPAGEIVALVRRRARFLSVP